MTGNEYLNMLLKERAEKEAADAKRQEQILADLNRVTAAQQQQKAEAKTVQSETRTV